MDSAAYVTIFTLLITTIAGVVANIATSVLAYLKARDAVVLGNTNAAGIQVVHALVNSQLAAWKAELIAHTDAAIVAALARGIAQGGAEERARTAALLAGVRADAAQSTVAANTTAMTANTTAVEHNTEGRAP